VKALVSPSFTLRASRLLVIAALAWAVLMGLAAGDLAARRTAAPVGEQWIVFASNRDGVLRGYSMLPDGERVTPLLARGRRLVPLTMSRDGGTVAYTPTWYGDGALYLSAASGGGHHRVAREVLSGAVLSNDGRWVAYSTDTDTVMLVRSDGTRRRRLLRRCSCYAADWSPNGKSLVLEVGLETDEGARGRVVVLPLRGKRRIVARTGEDTGQHENYEGATWSPDGRWIAYLDIEDNRSKLGLYVVRPNGKQQRRVVRGAVVAMAWSPDGKRLAFIWENGRLGVVGADGRGLQRLPLAASANTVEWSPDGRRLAVAASAGDATQIYVLSDDGRDVRRMTAAGENVLVGWTRRPPVLPPAPPLTPSERVLDARSVATASPIGALSADGARVAFAPKARPADCAHAAVWAPGEGTVQRFTLPAPCFLESFTTVFNVALAGSRVAWTPWLSEGKGECTFALLTATVADARATGLHGLQNTRSCAPDFYHLRGDGELLVFNDGRRIVRVGSGHQPCVAGSDSPDICSTVRRDQQGAVDSVSGNLIAVRRPGAVVVIDDRGQVIRTIPFSPADVRAARVDGSSLIVWRFAGLQVYDVSTGGLVGSHPVPPGSRLVDVDGGVAVLLGGDAVTLLRLADSASRILSPGRAPVLAELEPTGLYYSYATGDGGGRVAFLPRAEAVPAERRG
jgi:Tol biopolymer transport system component